MSEHPGLIFRTLEVAPADHPPDPLVRGWGEALARGFHDGRMSDEAVAVWLDGARADGMRLRGVWPEQSVVASGSLPVATYASWAGGPLNVGGGAMLPIHLITDVTVSPTHRRRGLLRALMSEDLADAAARGLPLAALTATEGRSTDASASARPRGTGWSRST